MKITTIDELQAHLLIGTQLRLLDSPVARDLICALSTSTNIVTIEGIYEQVFYQLRFGTPSANVAFTLWITPDMPDNVALDNDGFRIPVNSARGLVCNRFLKFKYL